MARWYFNRCTNREDRERYHDFEPCLLAARLEGLDEHLHKTETRATWNSQEHSSHLQPVPLCRACGLPIDADLVDVKTHYQIREES